MTKRKIFIYTLILGIIIYFVPVFVGQYTENQYKQFIQRMSEFEGAQLTSVSYKRHWRHATAKTRVTFTKSGLTRLLAQWQGPDAEGIKKLPSISFELEHEIQHGPFVKKPKDGWSLSRAFITSSLSLTPEAKKILEAEIGTTELVNFKSDVDFFEGSINIHLQGKPFRTQEQTEKEPPAWGGIRGTWRMNSSLDNLKADIAIPGFNLDIYDAHLEAEDILFNTEQKRIKPGLWEGNARLQIQDVTFDDPEDDTKLHAQAFSMSGAIQQKDQKINSTLFLTTQRMDHNERQVGPISLSMAMRNIPTDIYYLLREVMRNAPVLDEIPSSMMNNPEVLSALPALLEARPEVILQEIKMDTPEGRLWGQAGIAAGGEGISQGLQISSLVQSIVASAQFEIPKNMLRRVYKAQAIQRLDEDLSEDLAEKQAEISFQEKLASWLGAGYLIEKGDYYQFKFELINGQLKINGVAQPL